MKHFQQKNKKVLSIQLLQVINIIHILTPYTWKIKTQHSTHINRSCKPSVKNVKKSIS